MSWDELNGMSQSTIGGDSGQRIAGLMHALFRTPEGQEVLEAMRQRTEGRTTMPQAVMDGQAMALCMAVREGENNLYRWIVSMIRKGERRDG